MLRAPLTCTSSAGFRTVTEDVLTRQLGANAAVRTMPLTMRPRRRGPHTASLLVKPFPIPPETNLPTSPEYGREWILYSVQFLRGPAEAIFLTDWQIDQQSCNLVLAPESFVAK